MKRTLDAHARTCCARVLAARQLPLGPGAAARSSGYHALVAQGMQVAGPAYGLLLDAWGEDFLAHGTIELKFVGRVHRRRDRRGDRRRSTSDDATIDGRERDDADGPRSSATPPRHGERRRRDHARPPPVEHRVHVAGAPRAVPRRSRPSRRGRTTSTASSCSRTRSTPATLAALDAAIAPVRPGGARVPRDAARRPVQHRRASTPSSIAIAPRRRARRSCATSARHRCSPTCATTSSGRTRASTGSRRCTSSRTAPSRSSGTRTTATRTSSRRRTSRAGSRSPTRRSTTAASGCCPACTAPGTLAHVEHADRVPVLRATRDGAVAVPVQAGSIVVFSSLTPHATGHNTTDEVRKAYIVQYAPDGAVALAGRPRPRARRPTASIQTTERRQFPVVVGRRARRQRRRRAGTDLGDRPRYAQAGDPA